MNWISIRCLKLANPRIVLTKKTLKDLTFITGLNDTSAYKMTNFKKENTPNYRSSFCMGSVRITMVVNNYNPKSQ